MRLTIGKSKIWRLLVFVCCSMPLFSPSLYDVCKNFIFTSVIQLKVSIIGTLLAIPVLATGPIIRLKLKRLGQIKTTPAIGNVFVG